MIKTSEYKPDMRTRLAMQFLASKVPGDYTAARDRSELKERS